MRLYRELDIKLDKKEMICFVGAGGKTTAMFHLAKELKDLGKKVLVSTTTSIFFPHKEEFDVSIISHEIGFNVLFFVKNGSITVIGKELTKEGKLTGYQRAHLDHLFMQSNFDYILVEGDGARRKSIKAPAEYEPVIPSQTHCTVGVVGMDSMGKAITEENVHRVEQFYNLVNGSGKVVIDEKIIAHLIIHRKGLFKNAPKNSKRFLFLNKVEDDRVKKSVDIIADLINKNAMIDGIIAGSLHKGNLYLNWRDKK